MTFVLGITGSIAMGKSAVTRLFEQNGAITANADAIVHDLYREDADVIAFVREHWPQAVVDGGVNRKQLGAAVFGNPEAIKSLEAFLHPRVKAAEMAVVREAEAAGQWLVALDIPLLYETGAEKRCDYVVVVTAPADIQKSRALARPNMTMEKLEHILSLQMADAEKRARADFIIDTGRTPLQNEADVAAIVATLRDRYHARNRS